MPANPPEYDRQYRSLRKESLESIFATLLEIKRELKNLRKSLRKKGVFLADSDKTDSYTPLPLDSESTSLKERRSKRESEQARLARLTAWRPDDKAEEAAHIKGHDDRWLEEQAALYRNQQRNAKTKHKDFDAGFMSWILRSPLFEGKSNGNGHHKPSPAEKLFDGFYQAAVEYDERQDHDGGDQPVADPLLDRRR
jgi:hypothetical protein